MNSAAWTFLEMSFGQSLRLLSNLIMTRILLPEAFGLMAMVNTIIIAMNLFTDIGLRQSVIRSPRGDDPHFLRAAWTVQLVRFGVIAGLVLGIGLLLWLLGPVFAPSGTVYADPQLPFLTMAASMAVLLQGSQSINLWLADRRMEYARPALIAIGSQIVNLMSMLVLVMIYPSVWALLGGMLVGGTFKTILTHLVLKGPRMAVVWDEEVSRDLWTFGKWLIGSSMFTFLINNADRIILGALVDKETFGFYAIATIWVRAVVQVIQTLGARVGLSTLGNVYRNEREKFAQIYFRLTRAFAALSGLAFVASIAGGYLLFQYLYPPQYMQSMAFIPLLSIVILQQQITILSNVLLLQGESMWVMLNRGATAVLLFLALPMTYATLGIGGFLITLGIVPLITMPLLMQRAGAILGRTTTINWVWMVSTAVIAASVYFLFPV